MNHPGEKFIVLPLAQKLPTTSIFCLFTGNKYMGGKMLLDSLTQTTAAR